MATILEFPHLRPGPGRRRSRRKPADIVIFPGVRVERSDFNLAARIVPVRRRRRPVRSPVVEADD
jgi:hypothetical protein